MAKIVLHIGLRKTGTTSIQKFLNKNRQALLEHHILYPKSGLPLHGSVYAHHDLAVKITGIRPSTVTQCWTLLSDELKQHANELVFISSEIFSVATVPQIQEIRKNLSGHEVKVLIYLREPSGFMISMYKEQIKAHNEIRTLKKFLRKKIRLVDFDRLITRWENVFGESNVILKNYDDLTSGDQLITNLISSLGLESFSSEFSFIDKANVSPKDEVVNMIRHLNLIKKKFPLTESMKKKIQTDIRSLYKGQNNVSSWLKYYGWFLSKRIYKPKELAWLENEIHSISSNYKARFQNDIKLTSISNE